MKLRSLTKYTLHALALTVLGVMVAGVMATPKLRTLYPKTGAEFAKSSAMILAKGKDSGGSAVILHSDLNGSILLTNKHVCEVIQGGGFVETIDKTVAITHYKLYPNHDLCLINVKEDLGVRTQIAEDEPVLYSDMTVAGHPSLLPPIVSKGTFSNRKDIDVMVGMKECDGTEKEEEIMYCIFYGGKPIIKKYDSQVTSALIMPGSSGSPVFNDRGEVAGLVFAGSAGLSYSFIVPHKFVVDFVTNQNTYEWTPVDPKAKPKKFASFSNRVQSECKVEKSRFCQRTKFMEIWSAK